MPILETRRLRPRALNSKLVLHPGVDPDLSQSSVPVPNFFELDLKNLVGFGFGESGSEAENQ